MKKKISVIVPFFNESLVAHKTLERLHKQILQPDEVIFVDSNSNDNTSSIIKEFIIFHKIQNWKIYKTFLETPSEAKNYGIIKSNFDWCAFMDFDIDFKNDWLANQVKLTNDSPNKLIFYGTISLNPKNKFDKFVVIQTFGLKSLNPVIPSSLIHKKYFHKYGYFLPIRSYYDKVFIANSLKNNSYLLEINKQVKIKYLGVNYANNFYELFLKVLNYSLQAVYVQGYYVPYIYFAIFILIFYSLFFSKILFYFISFNLIIARSLFIPLTKNKYLFKNIRIIDIPSILLIGLFIDITKLIGFFSGFVMKLLNKKTRLDFLYK